MTVTRDAVPVIIRALEAGHHVELILEERIDDDGRGSHAELCVCVDGFLPGSPADLDRWLGVEVMG